MKARSRANWFQAAASCGILVAAALAFPNVGFANGRTFGPTSTITVANSAALGFSMASATQSDGSTIVVIGAPQANSGAGAAYVYTEAASSGWSTLNTPTTLTAQTAVPGSGFGDSVAVNSNGTIAVGAPGTATTSGAVYVFTPGNLGWGFGGSQSVSPTLTDSTLGEMFGISVGISTSNSNSSTTYPVLVVGADQAAGTDGAAYIYADSANGWSAWGATTPTISDPGKAAGDLFGNSVAITSDGGTIVVGSSGSTNNAGQAYVFTGSSWTTAATLFASGSVGFGTSVAIGGTSSAATAVVGAPGNASIPGAAYVFTNTTTTSGAWDATPAADLTTGTNGDFLGQSVAISGDATVIAVGAPDAPSTSSPTPAVYEFDAPSNGKHAGSWSAHIGSYTYQISNTGSTYFGDSAAVVIDSSGTAWIFGGAPGIPPITSSSPLPNPVPPGAAYVFTQ